MPLALAGYPPQSQGLDGLCSLVVGGRFGGKSVFRKLWPAQEK